MPAIANATMPFFVVLLAIRFKPSEAVRGLRLVGFMVGLVRVPGWREIGSVLSPAVIGTVLAQIILHRALFSDGPARGVTTPLRMSAMPASSSQISVSPSSSTP